MNKNIVHENERYQVMVGPGSDPDFKGNLYLVQNKETGVIETETRILPQAKLFANQLEESLKSDETENLAKVLRPDFKH